MKQKLSITMDEEKVAVIDRMLRDSRFRNKSHVIEYAVERFLEEVKK